MRVTGWDVAEVDRRATGLARRLRRAGRATTRAVAAHLVTAPVGTLGDAHGVPTRWALEVEDVALDHVRDTLYDAARHVRDVIGVGDDDPGDVVVEAHLAVVRARLRALGDHAWDVVRARLAAGARDGEPPARLVAHLRRLAVITPGRALAVSRDVTYAAHAAGVHAQVTASAGGHDTKTWVAVDDDRTRVTHREADGQRVPVTGSFVVGESRLAYPGDPTAPVDETAGCRCRVVYDVAGLADVPPDGVTAASGVQRWKPHQHPRGKNGRFIEKGAVQVLLSTSKPNFGQLSQAVGQLDQKSWDQLTGPQRQHIHDLVGKLPASSSLFTKFKNKIDELGGVSDTAPPNVTTSLPAHKGKAPGAPAKVTTTLVWGKYPHDTVILERVDEAGLRQRVVWNADTKRYDVRRSVLAVDAPGPSTWQTQKSYTKKDLYESLKNSTSWRVPGDVTTPTPTPPPPPAAPPSGESSTASVTPPNPKNLTHTGVTLGSHGAQVYVDEQGRRWLFKKQPSFATKLDVAASRLQELAGRPAAPTFAYELNGASGSIQLMHEGDDTWPSSGWFDPKKLTSPQVRDLLREHVVDWLLANHDSHSANFITLPDGTVAAVDKGNSLKFLGQDRLVWGWRPNEHRTVYDRLWAAYAHGDVDLTDDDTAALHDTIGRVQAVGDDELRTLFRPYAEDAAARGLLATAGKNPWGDPLFPSTVPPNDVDAFLDALVKRKHDLVTDFTSLHERALTERGKYRELDETHTPTVPAWVTTPALQVSSQKVLADVDELTLELWSDLTPDQKAHVVNKLYVAAGWDHEHVKLSLVKIDEFEAQIDADAADTAETDVEVSDVDYEKQKIAELGEQIHDLVTAGDSSFSEIVAYVTELGKNYGLSPDVLIAEADAHSWKSTQDDEKIQFFADLYAMISDTFNAQGGDDLTPGVPDDVFVEDEKLVKFAELVHGKTVGGSTFDDVGAYVVELSDKYELPPQALTAQALDHALGEVDSPEDAGHVKEFYELVSDVVAQITHPRGDDDDTPAGSSVNYEPDDVVDWAHLQELVHPSVTPAGTLLAVSPDGKWRVTYEPTNPLGSLTVRELLVDHRGDDHWAVNEYLSFDDHDIHDQLSKYTSTWLKPETVGGPEVSGTSTAAYDPDDVIDWKMFQAVFNTATAPPGVLATSADGAWQVRYTSAGNLQVERATPGGWVIVDALKPGAADLADKLKAHADVWILASESPTPPPTPTPSPSPGELIDWDEVAAVAAVGDVPDGHIIAVREGGQARISWSTSAGPAAVYEYLGVDGDWHVGHVIQVDEFEVLASHLGTNTKWYVPVLEPTSRAETSAPAASAPAAPPPQPATTSEVGDVSTFTKKFISGYFKHHDAHWYNKSEKIWATLGQLRQEHPELQHLSDLTVLRVLDSQLKKTDSPYETKIVKWVQTPSGLAKAKVSQAQLDALTGKTPSPSPPLTSPTVTPTSIWQKLHTVGHDVAVAEGVNDATGERYQISQSGNAAHPYVVIKRWDAATGKYVHLDFITSQAKLADSTLLDPHNGVTWTFVGDTAGAAKLTGYPGVHDPVVLSPTYDAGKTVDASDVVSTDAPVDTVIAYGKSSQGGWLRVVKIQGIGGGASYVIQERDPVPEAAWLWLAKPTGDPIKLAQLMSNSSAFPWHSALGAVTSPAVKPASASLPDTDVTTQPTPAQQKSIYTTFKAKPGTFLSSDPGTVYLAVKATADQYGVSVTQVLRVVDLVGAEKVQKPNTSLFEKKIVTWLQTPQGAAVAAGKKPPKPATPALAAGVDGKIPPLAKSDKLSYPVILTTQANILWQQALGAHGVPPTKSAVASVKTYTGGTYHSINGYLYGKLPDVAPTTAAHIKRVQEAMRPSTSPMLLHRAVYFDGVGGAHSHADLEKLVGSTWKSGGFFSTSVGGHAVFGGPVIIEVEAPPGTPMFWAKQVSHHPAENEMLLAAGLHYRIISVINTGSKSIVRVRVVPGP